MHFTKVQIHTYLHISSYRYICVLIVPAWLFYYHDISLGLLCFWKLLNGTLHVCNYGWLHCIILRDIHILLTSAWAYACHWITWLCLISVQGCMCCMWLLAEVINNSILCAKLIGLCIGNSFHLLSKINWAVFSLRIATDDMRIVKPSATNCSILDCNFCVTYPNCI